MRSVASFFVSRVDTEVDRRLETLAAQAAPERAEEILSLRGSAAVAQALPAALLAAAKQEITLLSYKEAAATLQRLRDNFSSASEARTARASSRVDPDNASAQLAAAGVSASGSINCSIASFSTLAEPLPACMSPSERR